MTTLSLSPATEDAAANDKVYQKKLVFYVNSERQEIDNPDPNLLLVDYLRSTEMGLTGTKHSCGQGGCGACTVTLSRYDELKQDVVHVAGNSCLRPVCSLDGMQVTTVEGIGSVNTEISPVQYQLAKCNGSQCGYCTPGFVMNMHSLLLQNEHRDLSEKEIQDAFDGNICRCTGFRPILFAMKQFAKDHDEKEKRGTPDCHIDPSMKVKHYDVPRAHFPERLRASKDTLAFQQHGRHWFRPLTLAQVHVLMQQYEHRRVKLVVGNTSAGIPGLNPPDFDVYIDMTHIDALHTFEVKPDYLAVGAAITYSELIDKLDTLLADQERGHGTGREAGFSALRYMAGRTAGTIVRNFASLAGNTMLVAHNATQGGTPFPSDAFTALCALDAKVLVQTHHNEPLPPMDMLAFVRRFSTDEAFRRHAIIVAYQIPYTNVHDHVTTYKVALREVNAHSLVNAGLLVRIDDHGTIASARLVFGAIAPVAFHARQTEAYLVGKRWDLATFDHAKKLLAAEVAAIQEELPEWFRQLPFDGISDAYRLSLAESFFYKFYVEVSGRIHPGSIRPEDRSAGIRFERGVSWGSQTFAKPDEGKSVGRPFIKLSAFEQTTGEAVYTHDIPVPVRGLYGSFVTSAKPKADFHYQVVLHDGSRQDVEKPALLAHLHERFSGTFVDYITYHDIPKGGVNGVLKKGTPKDPWFCEGSVTSFGQSIGLIVAKNELQANAIAAFVRGQCIAYTNIVADDIVLDIDTAVARKQFFAGYDTDDNHSLQSPLYQQNKQWVEQTGRVMVNGVPCEVIHGRQHCGSQIHFYMETQASVAYPGEGPEILVHSSTQNADNIRVNVQQTLALQGNQVSVDVKRLGGAYGGKTTRSPFVAVPTALAAAKLRRPVRVAMPRDVDTWMIGDRHAFRGDYSVAIACEGPQKGKLLGTATNFYSNGGNTLDCSFDVMDCAQLGADNAYSVPYFFTVGEVCQTNIHSNGAMRSYGGIQAMLIQEDGLESAAHAIGMLPETVREMNLYQNGDVTPFGQKLEYCYIREVWARLKRRSDFVRREQEVQAFNAKNRWRKRGISMIPLKYGLGFNLGFLMQGAALIDIYHSDGTVLVQIGGVEMGQGILTKVAQVAAKALNIPLRFIRMGTTQTSVIPDAMGTGATSGTDLCGGAALQAAQELAENLKALCQKMRVAQGESWCQTQGIDYWSYPNGWNTEVVTGSSSSKTLMWNNILNLAYDNRVDLSSQALYSTPGLVDATDQQFYGFTFSAACSEVEIDVLTGETTVLRSDICYDMGESINPAIDIGQIEGAFVMGVGYVLTEDVIFQPDGPAIGSNNTSNTWTYKPPASTTIPLELHVDLFPRDDEPDAQTNPNLLMGSKGVGEPPLVLAATVYFAVKHAALAARKDMGLDGWFAMHSPATVQRVREACTGGFGTQ